MRKRIGSLLLRLAGRVLLEPKKGVRIDGIRLFTLGEKIVVAVQCGYSEYDVIVAPCHRVPVAGSIDHSVTAEGIEEVMDEESRWRRYRGALQER